MNNFSFSFSTGSEINDSWIKHCWKWSNLWIHTLFAKSLHLAKWAYHTKKLKKSWASNIDRQFEQLISVFWERTLMWQQTSRMARKAQRKRAKTNSSKSGKRPRNNIRTSKSTAKLFERQKQFLDELFEKSWRSKELSLEKPRKRSTWTKKQRLIRKRWCSRMLKKPLGFYPASIFHRKVSTETFWIFRKEKYLKKNLKLPKKPKLKKRFIKSITFVVNLIALLMEMAFDTWREHLKSALNLRFKKRKV